CAHRAGCLAGHVDPNSKTLAQIFPLTRRALPENSSFRGDLSSGGRVEATLIHGLPSSRSVPGYLQQFCLSPSRAIRDLLQKIRTEIASAQRVKKHGKTARR